VLGLGLLISTYATTQQQAMLIFFFLMMIFVYWRDFTLPIDSMPEWAQWITSLIPLSYFIDVMRMVVLKATGFDRYQKSFAYHDRFCLY
jgi:ABC-2 type transport system permease protein